MPSFKSSDPVLTARQVAAKSAFSQAFIRPKRLPWGGV